MADRYERYQRLPGSKRQYRDTWSGEIYSRRQYDKLTSKTAVAPPKTVFRKKIERQAQTKRNNLYKSRAELLAEQGVTVTYTNKKGQTIVRPIGPGDVRVMSDTKALIKELAKIEARREVYKSGRNKGKKKPYSAADELRMREVLTALGRRRGIPDSVKAGDSEKWRKRLAKRRAAYAVKRSTWAHQMAA